MSVSVFCVEVSLWTTPLSSTLVGLSTAGRSWCMTISGELSRLWVASVKHNTSIQYYHSLMCHHMCQKVGVICFKASLPSANLRTSSYYAQVTRYWSHILLLLFLLGSPSSKRSWRPPADRCCPLAGRARVTSLARCMCYSSWSIVHSYRSW